MPWHRPAAFRPAWWKPEVVLEKLQSGLTAPEICHATAEECEGRISPVTLRADISRWAGSLSWGDQFQAALALYKNDGHTGLVISKDWYDEFFDAMDRAEGVVPAACILASIKETLVYALCDKRNKCYDPEFAERLRIAEGVRISKIRENALNEATTDAKIGLRVLESSMPSLHAPRQQVDVNGEVDINHKHTITLSPEVIAASQQRMRTLLAGRPEKVERPALPAGRDERKTITVIPRVKQEAS